MENLTKNFYFFFWLGLMPILSLDMVTKSLMNQGRMPQVVFIQDFFYFTTIHHNSGIAFGWPVPLWIQILGSIIILFLLIKMGIDYFFKERNTWLHNILLGMVVGGGLGNLIDRVMHASVIDFIVLGPIPIFNIADIGITVGLFLLFATIALCGKHPKCE